MTLQVKRYSEVFQEKWDEFISSSVNGTLMQERKFLSYHPVSRFTDHSLIFFEDNRIISVFPAAEICHNDGVLLVSHPGASHGGVILQHTLNTLKTLELVSALVQYCGDTGFEVIRVKPVPRIYHRGLAEQIDFALRFSGFKLEYTELATALELKPSNESIIKEKMNTAAFRNYQKALKSNLIVVEDADLREYWPVLVKKLKHNHNAAPTHTLEEIEYLKKLYPGMIKLFAAYKETVLVAGVVVFLLNERVINCFYIAHDDQYQEMRPLNLIFGYLMEWGRQNNFTYLDWGISTEAKGSRVNTGLFRFKEGFGGRGVVRESYVYSLSDKKHS